MGKYLDIAKTFEAKQQAESQSTSQRAVSFVSSPAFPSWPCPTCRGSVHLDPIREGEAPTQFWTCIQCSTWGATREGAALPTVWVSGGVMQ